MSNKKEEAKGTSLLQEHTAPKKTSGISRPPLSLWKGFVSRHGISAYVPVIIVNILMFCGISWQIFWTTTDAARYQCYALTFWLGSDATHLLPSDQCSFLSQLHSQLLSAPFHMLPLEYPPLTLVLFSLAQLAPLGYYQLAFAFVMALVVLFIYWILLRYGPANSWLAFALYALIGGWATAEGRFDLVPAALTLLCIIAAERKQWTFAYIALALGVLIKIYPLLLFPALFIAEQRDAQRFHTPPSSLSFLPFKNLLHEIWSTLAQARAWKWKNTLLFFALIIGITGLFALLDFQGAVLSQLDYFARRPVQIESTGSALLWLATFFGVHSSIIYTFGSINVLSPLSGNVSLLFEIGLVLGYIYVIWLQWREKLDIVQASIAIVLVFITTGKVFSPQYLIWLMPLLAYSGAFDYFWLIAWGSISLLTTLIYPYLYTRDPNILNLFKVPGFIQTIAIRDALFLLLTLAYLFNWFHIRHRKPLPDKEDRVDRIDGVEEQELQPLYVETASEHA